MAELPASLTKTRLTSQVPIGDSLSKQYLPNVFDDLGIGGIVQTYVQHTSGPYSPKSIPPSTWKDLELLRQKLVTLNAVQQEKALAGIYVKLLELRSGKLDSSLFRRFDDALLMKLQSAEHRGLAEGMRYTLKALDEFSESTSRYHLFSAFQERPDIPLSVLQQLEKAGTTLSKVSVSPESIQCGLSILNILTELSILQPLEGRQALHNFRNSLALSQEWRGERIMLRKIADSEIFAGKMTDVPQPTEEAQSFKLSLCDSRPVPQFNCEFESDRISEEALESRKLFNYRRAFIELGSAAFGVVAGTVALQQARPNRWINSQDRVTRYPTRSELLAELRRVPGLVRVRTPKDAATVLSKPEEIEMNLEYVRGGYQLQNRRLFAPRGGNTTETADVQTSIPLKSGKNGFEIVHANPAGLVTSLSLRAFGPYSKSADNGDRERVEREIAALVVFALRSSHAMHQSEEAENRGRHTLEIVIRKKPIAFNGGIHSDQSPRFFRVLRILDDPDFPNTPLGTVAFRAPVSTIMRDIFFPSDGKFLVAAEYSPVVLDSRTRLFQRGVITCGHCNPEIPSFLHSEPFISLYDSSVPGLITNGNRLPERHLIMVTVNKW